jgi:hypothetical protein
MPVDPRMDLAGVLAASWWTSYADYLARATGRSASTAHLFRQVLDCSARRQLTAAAFDGADRSPPEDDEMDQGGGIAASARFFEALEAVGAARARELADSVMSDPAGPDPRLVEHVRRVNGLAFELLNQLGDAAARHEAQWLRGLLASASGTALSASDGLRLDGRVGDAASALLSVENSSGAPVVIRCAASDVRRADGVGPAFAARLGIAPRETALKPGEQTAIRVTVGLDSTVYEPDAEYVGTLSVFRDDHPRLDVPIRISTRRGTDAGRWP